jgi:nicotinamidase-related amidase
MEQHNQAALLVMDMQTSILHGLADTSGLVSSVKKAILAAREKKLAVIYVTVGFRAGMPEISSRNKGFTAARERFAKADMATFSQIEPSLGALPNEIVVTKRRISAFTGSDLEVVLRAQGIQEILLCGIATSGVVLSTLREAADKDYRINVLSDCCADADEEVHRVLTTKVFPRQAEVISVDEWMNAS